MVKHSLVGDEKPRQWAVMLNVANDEVWFCRCPLETPSLTREQPHVGQIGMLIFSSPRADSYQCDKSD